ncbi:MAG: iron ABC transporter substrate-binding protein [Prolixibacteraceae bacterium]|nr:iron ABC transporter substrate-binding protein [Prolixibacteraceae bacterium]MBN2648767.1 iron ABC transporter substrate-binding protein [Prolixibacteraceae bacterium]
MKKTILILCVLMQVLFLACKHQQNQNAANTRTFTDMLGRQVQLPDTLNRIVGVRASALRMLLYMDAADKIVGIEDIEHRNERPYILAHPELLKLPTIGPMMGGDAELILKVRPEAIFITYATIEDADRLQKQTGIPVVAIDATEFGIARDTLFSTFRMLGKILHKEARADSLVHFINHNIEELDQRTNDLPETEKPTAYIGGVPYSGAHGITSTQPYYPPFMFLNAKNVAAEVKDESYSHVRGTYIDKEQLLLWNPGYIFIDNSGLLLTKNDLASGSSLQESLNAIQNGQTHVVMPYNNYATNYELVLANAWYIGKVLYPEQFADINIKEKTNEITQQFLGAKLYDSLTSQTPIFEPINLLK